MANEITITNTIRWARFGVTLQASNTVTASQTGTAAVNNIQSIGATSESVLLGDVTDPAYLYFKNVDVSKTIYVSNVSPAAAGTAPHTLGPGDAVLITSTQTAWYAIASVAGADLAVLAIQR